MTKIVATLDGECAIGIGIRGCLGRFGCCDWHLIMKGLRGVVEKEGKEYESWGSQRSDLGARSGPCALLVE